jgi:16S rRNA (guanine966-N2)-methyltransferase
VRKADGVRVIAGSLGGREIRAPRGDRTRPTSDKVRQATFNILGSLLFSSGASSPGASSPGASSPASFFDSPADSPFSGIDSVLDLFAGSGALGIEALSRGAGRAVFVDHAPEAIRAIAANLADLGIAERAEIVRGDVKKVLGRLRGPFGLVFADPPYTIFARPAEARAHLAALPALLSPDGVAVIEHDRRSAPDATIGRLALLDRRRYGDTEVSFYR